MSWETHIVSQLQIPDNLTGIGLFGNKASRILSTGKHAHAAHAHRHHHGDRVTRHRVRLLSFDLVAIIASCCRKVNGRFGKKSVGFSAFFVHGDKNFEKAAVGRENTPRTDSRVVVKQ